MNIYKCIHGGVIKAENAGSKRDCFKAQCDYKMMNGKCGSLTKLRDSEIEGFTEVQLVGNVNS